MVLVFQFLEYNNLFLTTLPTKERDKSCCYQKLSIAKVSTYFGHISSMEARIFMKFETYVHKIIPYHQLNFHKDPCKDARARGENARTCDALQRFRSESTKIKKMRFSAIFE